MAFPEKLPECKNLLADLSETMDEDSMVEPCNVTADDDGLSKPMEHIKVYLRIRPVTADERAQGVDDGCIRVESDRSVIVSAPRMSHAFHSSNYGISRQQQRFTFTHVFPPDTSQKQFFDGTVNSMVSEFVSGQNCLIFTYGVTNSGKTYTIQGGSKSNAGILPRSLDVIFNRIAGRQCTDMSLKPVMFGDVARLTACQIKEEKKLKQSILCESNAMGARVSSDQASSTWIVKNSGDVSEAEPVDMDETTNPRVSHAMSDDSLEARPSVIQGSADAMPHSEEANIRFILWASFAEIYNEQIFDLLESAGDSTTRATRPSPLLLRDDRDGRPYIRGLREVQVSNVEEVWRLVQIGRDNQHISATRMNRASSRSHSIFTLRLVQVMDVEQPVIARVASLSFCDLAGSERYTTTGGLNERVKEACKINSSLLKLGRCIQALRKNQARRDHLSAARASVVPFRESKLTRLFQNFLCGEGRVVMIINVSQCANVFDETLHAVKYSALARQIVTGSTCPLFSFPGTLTGAENQKVSFHGKTEAAAGAQKPAAEKKRKLNAIEENKSEGCAQNLRADQKQLAVQEDILPEDDESDEDEDAGESWREERVKMVSVIKKLHDALNEERQAKVTLETEIRAEVCEEMEKQLVRIQSEHQETIRRHGEILEQKYDRKMEIYMEAVQKSCKRQRRNHPGEGDEDYGLSIDLHAAEVKLSRYADEISELKTENVELQHQLDSARENVGQVSAERDVIAGKLTKMEFSASDVQQQFEALLEEKRKTRADHTRLQKTVEELSSKLTEVEHRHEVSCRQLRREKALLEQKLSEAGKQTVAQTESNAETSNGEEKMQKDQVAELQTALKSERDNVQSLEQQLKLAEDDAKAVDRTWSEHCKEIEARFLEKCHELSKLQENYYALASGIQETEKSLEEAKANCVQSENALTVARKELSEKQMELEKLTSASESLKEEMNKLKSESQDVNKNFVTELHAKEAEYEKLHAEIKVLKQEASATESCQEKLKEVQNELNCSQEKLKKLEKEKAETEKSLNADLKKTNAQLVEAQNQLASKLSEVGRLEKKLEKERSTRNQLENVAADSEKKISDLKLQLSEEKEKSTEVQSSVEALKTELTASKKAQRTAEENIAAQLEDIATYEAKLVAAKKELDVVKEQLHCKDGLEKDLLQQLSCSSQLNKEVQDQLTDSTTKLAEKDEKYQTCCKQISDLSDQLKTEHEKLERVLNDAHASEAVVSQMRLTLKEQDMTMQTQDKALLERDSEVEALKAQLARANADHEKVQSLNDQLRQKNSRIRELEKEVNKVEKSRQCLEKDVCDTTAELRTSERNLTDARKELADAKHVLENLKSEETSAKAVAKQLCQKEHELSNLRKQLESAHHKHDKLAEDLEKANEKCHTSRVEKEKEMSTWREERDKLVAGLEKEIQDMKAAAGTRSTRLRLPSSDNKSEIDALQKKIEQLSRTVEAKDQAVNDLREQNFQLQQQLNHHAGVEHPERKTGGRRSKIPTSNSNRIPLRATDENADVSMGVLTAGGSAVDLDETVTSKRRMTRRLHAPTESSQLPRTSEVVAEQSPRATRTRRKRTTGIADMTESSIAEVEEDAAPQVRKLRSRRF